MGLPTMKHVFPLMRKLGWLLILGTLLSCGGGGAPGSNLGGPMSSLDSASTSTNTNAAVTTTTAVGDTANIPMPDIAVGPSTDIEVDKMSTKPTWRVWGGGVALCVTSENPIAFSQPWQNH